MSNVGRGIAGQVYTGKGSLLPPSFQAIGTNSGLTNNGVVLSQGNSAFVSTTVGTTGQVLKSTGVSTSPTWQSEGSYSLQSGAVVGFGPADATTYYVSPFQSSAAVWTTTIVSAARIFIPRAGTLTAAYGMLSVAATLGSSENITIAIRVNDTSNTNVTTTVQASSASNPFSNSALNIALSAGDFITFMVITPTWVTNPTAVYLNATVFIS